MFDQHYQIKDQRFLKGLVSVQLHVMKYTPCFVCFFLFVSLSFPMLPPLLSFRYLSKVKVCDLEQKCRSQSEHFHELSKELLNFRLQSDTVDILQNNPTSKSQIPFSPQWKFPQDIVGFETQLETGESVRLKYIFRDKNNNNKKQNKT